MKHTEIIKFGKFKGEMLGNVPAWYLLWFYENVENKSTYIISVKDYIADYIKDILSENKYGESLRAQNSQKDRVQITIRMHYIDLKCCIPTLNNKSGAFTGAINIKIP